jgi:hypothetical protein
MATLALAALSSALPACVRGTPTAPGAPEPRPSGIPARVTGLVIDGLVFPIVQFDQSSPDRCNAPHWHVHSTGTAASIGTLDTPDTIVCPAGFQFRVIPDPDPGACGFGRVADVRVVDAFVDRACYDAWDNLY